MTSLGYLVDEMSFGKSEEFKSATQAAQREIARAKKGAAISPHEIISAFGVDPNSQEIWLAFGDLLLHFDRDGRTISTAIIPTSSRAHPWRLLSSLWSRSACSWEVILWASMNSSRVIPAARARIKISLK